MVEGGMALMLMNSFMGFLTCGTKSDFLLWSANGQHVLESTYQLPQTTQPLEYWLEINPNMMAKTFMGEVKIKILANANTSQITLHSKDLNIVKVVVTNLAENKINESSYTLDDSNDTLNIAMRDGEELLAGNKYKVKITFAGVLSKNNPFGFVLYWRTKYERRRGKEDAYLTDTLLEPLFARKAFPCYDEIRYRTPFTISIAQFADETAISNMPAASDVSNPKYESKKLRIFEKTSPIPTHMVMYAIFNQAFQSIQSMNKYFIWTIEEFIYESNYPLNVLTSVGEKMTEIFANVAYKPRIDLVIVVHSKMWIQSRENPWGSMLYVGNQFLCKPEQCWASYQQQIITNIIRQVTYKWFGNYVSVDSWNYLWLKDGFAKYFGFELIQQECVSNSSIFDFFKTRPCVRMSQLHGSVQMQSILNDDARIFFEPITRSVTLSMRDIFKMYKYEDYEFYNGKAALLLRMLEHIVGRSTFAKALQRYLTFSNEHRGGLVKPADLWEAFERQLEEDRIKLNLPENVTISSMMNGWTESAGYPLVIASKSALGGDITIRQMSYPTEAQIYRKSITKTDWVIPITYVSQNNPNFDKTTPTAWCVDQIALPSDSVTPYEWYIINVQNTGYYRVTYEDDNWRSLIRQLYKDPSKIDALNRAQLVSDSHQLAIDGIINVEIPIMLSKYLINEKDPIVWTVAFRSIRRFYLALREEIRPMYQEFFVPLLKKAYGKFQFQVNGNDDRVTKMWRNELLNFLCWINELQCVTEAEKMYQDYRKHLTRIDPDLQFVVFCTVLRGQTDVRPLKQLLTDDGTRHNVCLTDLLHKVKNCAAFPRGHAGYIALYETLFDRILKNDHTIARSILSELSNYWDTALLLLKRIEVIISEWRSSKNFADTEINAMADLIGFFNGKVTGTAERTILNRMIQTVDEMLDERFEPIKSALQNVYNSIDRTGEITNRRDVEAYLLKWSYIDLQISAANDPMFDDIQNYLPQDELNTY